MIDWATPGKAIELAITASGLNRTAFRKAVGMSHVQLWRLSRGMCKPQKATRVKIESFLDDLISMNGRDYHKSSTVETPPKGLITEDVEGAA